MALITTTEHVAHLRWAVTARLVYLLCAMVICASGVLALATLPGFISVEAEKQNLITIKDAATKNLEEQEKNAGREALLISKRRVSALASVVARSGPSAQIRDVLEMKPEEVTVTAFSYAHKNGEGTLVVSGTVGSRSALSGFVQTLEASKKFAAVVVPITTLARVEEGEFDITLSGAF